MNRLASVGAAAQFAAERAEIGAVVGTPNQVEGTPNQAEAVAAHVEQALSRSADPG